MSTAEPLGPEGGSTRQPGSRRRGRRPRRRTSQATASPAAPATQQASPDATTLASAQPATKPAENSAQPRSRRNRRGRSRAKRNLAGSDKTPAQRQQINKKLNKPANSNTKTGDKNPTAKVGPTKPGAAKSGPSKSGIQPTQAARTIRETSAGGLVLDVVTGDFNTMRAALIGRLDRRGRMLWSLPKGHIEIGETTAQTAIREVSEETGLSGNVLAELGKIDYWFVTDGRRVHKTVHHYLLEFTGGDLCTDDVEVTEVAWVPLNELATRLTYSDERKLINVARKLIADLTGTEAKSMRAKAESFVAREPNDYEKAAAKRNSHRNDPPSAEKATARPNRRRRRGSRGGRGRTRPAAADGGSMNSVPPENPGGATA